ncbi:MAG: DUF4145 domain-containing protein [Planctomycetia bacterium]|nr:DUF4145 domain-containing protein [Planctomycetia bacterium]
MKVTIWDGLNFGNFCNIATRCPHCGYNGTFIRLGSDIQINNGSNVTNHIGIHQCPNVKCKGHLFFIEDGKHNLQFTSPNNVIPFDSENIPEGVLSAFNEAIVCHSNNCYVASAIMIRKTLEEICEEKKSEGDNLKKRLSKLGSKIIIPKELITGMNDLRLLGNDAAHIEARTFNDVGREEIEISIEFTKEILKAVYQYEGLLSKMKKLKTDSKHTLSK